MRSISCAVNEPSFEFAFSPFVAAMLAAGLMRDHTERGDRNDCQTFHRNAGGRRLGLGGDHRVPVRFVVLPGRLLHDSAVGAGSANEKRLLLSRVAVLLPGLAVLRRLVLPERVVLPGWSMLCDVRRMLRRQVT